MFLLGSCECLELGGVGGATECLEFLPDGFVRGEAAGVAHVYVEEVLFFFIGEDVVDEFCELVKGDATEYCLCGAEGQRVVVGIFEPAAPGVVVEVVD